MHFREQHGIEFVFFKSQKKRFFADCAVCSRCQSSAVAYDIEVPGEVVSEMGKLVVMPKADVRHEGKEISNLPELQVSRSVKVKNGVKDPDFGYEIAGYQGRIIDEWEDMCGIRWDSITLSEMWKAGIIRRCEKENLEWRVMDLLQSEVEPVPPRDTVKELEDIVCDINTGLCQSPRAGFWGTIARIISKALNKFIIWRFSRYKLRQDYDDHSRQD